MVPLPDWAEVREVKRARRARSALDCKNVGILTVVAKTYAQEESLCLEYVQ